MRAARWLAAPLAALTCLVGAVPAQAAPGPPAAPQYWFDDWDVPGLWAAGARGQGVVVAVIDTGVNAGLPELRANVLPGKDFTSLGGDGRVDRDLDDFGHGTAMASLIVARPGQFDIQGMAPDARVLPVAVPLRGTAGTTAGRGDRVPEAIRWAVDHGAKVVSLSLGGSRPRNLGGSPCPKEQQEAVNYAIGKGAVVVAASGNAGRSGSPVEEPGVCLGVVSVGAVDSAGKVAPFSSRHPYLTLSAPGARIPTLGKSPGQGFYGDGTSHATAITSAALALVWSKHPRLSAREVVARVLFTLAGRRPTRDPAYGYGRLDTARAVRAAVPANAPNPVFDAVAPFIARQRAAALPPAPPPKAPTPVPTAVAPDPPDALPDRVAAGIAVGAAGLLCLGALTVLGLVGVRRRVRADENPPPVPAPEPVSHADESGLVWHDVHLTAQQRHRPEA